MIPQQQIPQGQPQGQPKGGQPGVKEAEVYQRLVVAAMKLIYEKETTKNLVEMMRGEEDPVQALASAAMAVIGRLQEGAKGIPPNFVFSTTATIVTFLAEIGGAAKLFKPSAGMVKQATQAVEKQAQEGLAQDGGAPQGSQAQQPPQVPAAAPQGPPAGIVAGAMQPMGA